MSSVTPSSLIAKRWAFLVVVLLNTLVAILIARQIIAYQHYPFDIDEANHANGALALWLELRAGDLTGFAREFYSQSFYPPGFAWLKALAFGLFGPSPLVARFFSLTSLYLAILVIYSLCVELDETYGWLSGLVATILTLSMQPLLVTSAMVMTEAPGLLVSVMLLWSYVRALKRPAVQRLALTSLLLALTFLTKYTYGVVATATLLVMELSFVFPARKWISPGPLRLVYGKVRDVAVQRWLWLFGPFTLAMLIWFGRADKITTFLGYARPLSSDEPWLSTQDLLFYPRSVILHDVPSPLFALVTLAGLLWAAARWRNLALRLLLIYFIVGMAIVSFVNHPKNPRFIVTFVPAAHVLTG
ncbi:MAG TPA: glycosyltransferase family 39 protein, partial [Anaerolineae bacterium]